MAEKIFKWLIFSVLVGLLPIAWSALRLDTQGQHISLSLLCSRGELILISCAIAAGAIGELFASGRRMATLKIITGGFCVLVLMIGSLWYADITGYIIKGETYDLVKVAKNSLILYGSNLIAASGCIILSEVRN